MRQYRFTALAALLVAGQALPAVAQPALAPVSPQARADGHCPGKGHPMNHTRHQAFGHDDTAMLAMSARHPKGTVAFYRAELAITPAQEPQWAAFATVLGDAIVAMHAAREQIDTTPPPAPSRNEWTQPLQC